MDRYDGRHDRERQHDGRDRRNYDRDRYRSGDHRPREGAYGDRRDGRDDRRDHSRNDRRDYGKHDRRGYGDQGGYHGGGFSYGGRGRRNFGGRGRGGAYGMEPVAIALPDRSAEEGTAARPGRTVRIKSKEDVDATITALERQYPESAKEIMKAPRATRPGHGTKGKEIRVRVNHFLIECSTNEVEHFDVKVAPIRRDGSKHPGDGKMLPPETLREVLQQLAVAERWQRGWAFDGRANMFTTTRMFPDQPVVQEVTINDPDKGRPVTFAVAIKWAASISIYNLLDFIRYGMFTVSLHSFSKRGVTGPEIPQTSIQALDVAMKHSAMMSPHFLLAGRNSVFKIDSLARPLRLGGGAVAYQGWNQSVRFGEGCLTLNLDLTCTAFLEEVPVVEFLRTTAGSSDMGRASEVQFRKARKAIIGLKVQTNHMGGGRKRSYKVRDLDREGPGTLTFENVATNTPMTVEQYFQAQYGVRLQHPSGWCLNVGNKKKPIYLPPEVCVIAKGQRRLKLDDKQTAEMIKTAAKRPNEREAFIRQVVNEYASFPEDKTLEAFDVCVEPNLLEVNARVLPAPSLEYKNTMHPPTGGVWNMRGQKFHTGARLETFAVASFCAEREVGRTLPVPPPAPPTRNDDEPGIQSRRGHQPSRRQWLKCSIEASNICFKKSIPCCGCF